MFEWTFEIKQKNFVFGGGRIMNYANCKLFFRQSEGNLKFLSIFSVYFLWEFIMSS
jgi:hypothetical protein